MSDTTKYNVIEIFTNEEARFGNRPLYEAVVDTVQDMKIAGRCFVTKGTDACYENGEISTRNILTLSFNLPVKIDIIIPSPELDRTLSVIDEMVEDGIVAFRELNIKSHKAQKHLIQRQIRVKDIMTRSPEVAITDTPVSEVAKVLLSSIFTGMPVVDQDNHPVGIITQGDLIYRAKMPVRLGILADSDRADIDSVLKSLAVKTSKKIMTWPAITIREDASVTDAASLMLKKNVKRLPVIDGSGKIQGMLSRLDIFQTITKESPDWQAFQKQNVIVKNIKLVSDIMRRDSHTVLPETSVEEVIRIIDSDDIQRVSVVDKDNKFMGLISDKDLLAAFSDQMPGIRDYLSSLISFKEKGKRHKTLREKLCEKKAGEVMKKEIVTVFEDIRIDEAVKIMVERRLKRLPVIDSKGRFKGMISRDSLLRTGFQGT